MDEDLRILEQEYCPPLDPALVHAIFSDFTTQPDGLQQVKELLDGLKQTAADEQLTDFDPSGSSGDAVRSSPSKQGSDDAESNAETWTTRTTATDDTSLSNDLATLGLEHKFGTGPDNFADGGYFQDTAGFDTMTKEMLLADTFPTLRPGLVAYTLKKCDDDFEKATDELLNQVYLEDVRGSPTEETVVKGIDAFSEDFSIPQRKKKGKGKRKKEKVALYDTSAASASESDIQPVPSVNRWKDSSRDIDFLTSRTNLSPKAVASIYHENGASLATTITTFVRKEATLHGKDEPDPGLIQSAAELTGDFPSIDLAYAFALLRLTAPSTAHAHELAKATTLYPGTSSLSKGGIQLIPRYAPVDLSDSTNPPSTRLPTLAPSATPRTTASLASARNEAFSQASAAHRKGRSDPLMRAAAGYYAQLGRDTHSNLQVTSERDADALVASQSDAAMLDLHGVTVHNATRIAKQRTQTWWDGLGEQRIPGGGRLGGAGVGFRIVTGVGRHSEGGRGRLGPAVVRALVCEGWKVEVGSGEVVVRGVARRR